MNEEQNYKTADYVSISEANIITGIHPQTLRCKIKIKDFYFAI